MQNKGGVNWGSWVEDIKPHIFRWAESCSKRNNEGYTCVSEGEAAGGWLGRAVGVLLLQVVTVGAILTWIEQRNTNHRK